MMLLFACRVRDWGLGFGAFNKLGEIQGFEWSVQQSAGLLTALMKNDMRLI